MWGVVAQVGEEGIMKPRGWGKSGAADSEVG